MLAAHLSYRYRDFILRSLLLLTLASLLSAGDLNAQVVIISPRPGGIMQIHDSVAHLRLMGQVPAYALNFRVSVDLETSSSVPFHAVTVSAGVVDTTFSLPFDRRAYRLSWQADSAGEALGGMISGLSEGHIIGIAGQSNAQGYCWEMNVPAAGDIRMLRNNSYWEPAAEPTGYVAGGPWIVMANRLLASIGDSLPIGIVNTAIGGTGLTLSIGSGRWQRDPNNPEDSSIYGNALRKLRYAGGEIEALTWIQGEADASFLPVLDTYLLQYSDLMHGLRQDLGSDFEVYHLQIHGNSSPGAWVGYYSRVREAHRRIENSILVGTAVGRSVRDDGLHYDVTTLHAVGKMFADAILSTLYHRTVSCYPPLLPDSAATLDLSKGYCTFRFTRAGKPVKLTATTGAQYFSFFQDGTEIDTGHTWYRITPDSTGIEIGLTDRILDASHHWYLNYIPTAGADRAPIATVTSSGDTLFGVGFWTLPVESLSTVSADPPAEMKIQIAANDAIVTVPEFMTAPLAITIFDTRGALVEQSTVVPSAGVGRIPLSTLRPGWYALRATTGAGHYQSASFVH